MKHFLRNLFLILMALTLLFLSAACKQNRPTQPLEQTDEKKDPSPEPQGEDPVLPQEPDRSFESLTLPVEAIKSLSENGLTPESYALLASNGNNTGLSFLSTMISPDYLLSVNGTEVPVYCSLAYVGDGHGTIQSFATVFVNNPSNFELEISLTPLRGLSFENPVLLKGARETACSQKEGLLTATLTSTGNYTVLRGEKEQDNCFTLFVKENVDDAERIANYRKTYGDGNVRVFEAGVHEVQNLMLGSGSVLYLCKGALLVAKPIKGQTEGGLIEINSVSNVTVAGYGVMELSQLDHSARIAFRSYGSNKVTLKETMFVNGGSWNIYFYNSTNCTLSNLTVIGHRMNSDGINICNSRTVTVDNCWVRTGDDCFSAKTLGGGVAAILSNVTFQNCSAWAGKARCFGITGEAEKPMLGLTFSDCDILFQDAVWDLPRLGGLAIVLEAGSANNLQIKEVLFENIYIYCEKGAPMNVNVYGNDITGLVLEVTFKNIVCKEAGKSPSFSASNASNSIQVTLEDVSIAGIPLTEADIVKDAFSTVTIVQKP